MRKLPSLSCSPALSISLSSFTILFCPFPLSLSPLFFFPFISYSLFLQLPLYFTFPSTHSSTALVSLRFFLSYSFLPLHLFLIMSSSTFSCHQSSRFLACFPSLLLSYYLFSLPLSYLTPPLVPPRLATLFLSPIHCLNFILP